MATTFPLRRILILSALAIVALGAIALTGWWHPNAPMESMQMYLPKITLPAVKALSFKKSRREKATLLLIRESFIMLPSPIHAK